VEEYLFIYVLCGDAWSDQQCVSSRSMIEICTYMYDYVKMPDGPTSVQEVGSQRRRSAHQCTRAWKFIIVHTCSCQSIVEEWLGYRDAGSNQQCIGGAQYNGTHICIMCGDTEWSNQCARGWITA
jgi:hypothetical protein